MDIQIIPKKIFHFLLYCIGILIILNSIALIGKLGFGHPTMKGFSALVLMDAENNIPTIFTSLVILLCSLVLFLIGFLYKKNDWKFHHHWTGLGIIFLFIGLDEILVIHELIIIPLREKYNATGVFYFTWVVPALALVPLFLLFYYKFLRNLPKETARLFLISGSIYVLGGLGLEMVGAYIYYGNRGLEDPKTLIYVIITTLEESLEMLGMALFLFALLSFLANKRVSIKFALKD